jgi:transposase
MSVSADQRDGESTQEHILSLLASGNAQGIIELFAALESRAEAEASRAEAEASRAEAEASRAKAAVDEADALGERVRKLEHLTKHLQRLLYGRRSEKLTNEEIAQLCLLFGGDGGAETPTPEGADERDEEPPPKECSNSSDEPKKGRPNHRGRTALPPDLERIVIGESRVAEDARICCHCGDPMSTFDWVEHETVEYIPARFVVHVERREKVACKKKNCPGEAVTAERTCPSALPMRVGASVLAHLVESKCDDSLPIYRLRDSYARLGFDVPLNTLYRYWTFALDLLIPVAEVTLSVVLDDEIVFIDDTGMPVLDESKDSGKFRGHLWAFKGYTSKMVAFQFTETWEATDVQPWIEAITGMIQVDDYKGYSATVESMIEIGKLIQLVPDERRLGCMMHVRRRFYEAFELGDKRAAPAIDYIRKLYQVEAEAKKLKLDADGRLALRKEKSLPLLDALFKWIVDLEPKLGKTSKLARAVRYAINQRPFVERCFTDGRFEIDNGEIERVLKKPCVGRKNYLHCGSVAGAKRLAAAYTLVLSCKSLGINVNEYLIDVITKLANGWPLRRIRELLPDAWAAARAAVPAPDPAGQ